LQREKLQLPPLAATRAKTEANAKPISFATPPPTARKQKKRSSSARKQASRIARGSECKAEAAAEDEAFIASAAKVKPVQLFSGSEAEATLVKSDKRQKRSGSNSNAQAQGGEAASKPDLGPDQLYSESSETSHQIVISSSSEKKIRDSSHKTRDITGNTQERGFIKRNYESKRSSSRHSQRA